jgi:hypothetical protein
VDSLGYDTRTEFADRGAQAFTVSVLAMLVADSALERFGPDMWPNHRAFYELSLRAPRDGTLAEGVRLWEFAPSDDGLYAIRDIGPVLWQLSAEGWLQRRNGGYEISQDMRSRGRELLSQLSPEERNVVGLCADQWTSWSNMASNTSS